MGGNSINFLSLDEKTIKKNMEKAETNKRDRLIWCERFIKNSSPVEVAHMVNHDRGWLDTRYSRLKDKFGSDDSYGQRYLPAAVLEGATAANGYTPNKPYTVTMEASVNKHQELQLTDIGLHYAYSVQL